MFKALFVRKIFKFLSRIFGHVGKQSDNKAKINFKIYDVVALCPEIGRVKIFLSLTRPHS